MGGRHAVITGGATGLGFAIAQRMLASDARVTLWDRDRAALVRACAELGPKAFSVVVDVAEHASVVDALRLTLDQVVLADVPPEHTPVTLRVSLHGPPPDQGFEPGQVVLTMAHLAAPESAAEPGGFDFRRMAFFNQLGAVGYSGSPVVLWGEGLPVDDVAGAASTVGYELLCAVAPRVPFAVTEVGRIDLEL
jgi:NAD(P)-dependent dehydrogenase (short-subunit alcohol dehydrogenase family)